MAKEIRAQEVEKVLNAKNESLAISWASRTLNSIIIELFYKKNGHKDFKTFVQWKEEGKKIIKGSKAFIIWGRSLEVQKEEQSNETDEDEMKFFSISHIFSNKQVEEMKV